MREDTVMKQQKQVLAVPNSDSVTPDKPFILDDYNNCMNLKKINRIKYFTKAHYWNSELRALVKRM